MKKPKKVAIIQSNYLPWKGYFDIINSVDEFIIYDEVQYTTEDWRNRNLIKIADGGVGWITIPVSRKNHLAQKISEATIIDKQWSNRHWERIRQNYRKAKHYSLMEPIFHELYNSVSQEMFLSRVNFHFLQKICTLLGITTKISWSTEYPGSGYKTQRLVSICSQANADIYLSGPTARDYLDESAFLKQSMKVEWMDYSNYPQYPQQFGTFTHKVSIVDLLFNAGDQTPFYIWGWRSQQK